MSAQERDATLMAHGEEVARPALEGVRAADLVEDVDSRAQV